ncbi:MAG: acetate--CoA ligase family protein [Planctomycetota bacterium]|nr:acetate--CoA ligase family protein [Planctomycetota bacterium]MDI6787096.1 acetate--CoA ligase family protein [Planctomycetota bacterium]
MLDKLFSPKSIAVIGASNRPLTIGYRIIQNLKDIGFKGPIYPVNPKDPEINGFKAYPSITAVQGNVDLAHIVVKNTMVPQIMEECGKKGVKAVIINTAGFKEIGSDGIALENQVVEIGRRQGVRICGPNCQGVMNTEESNPVYANFTYTRIKSGFISILAQSGGVGEVINQRLSELGIGIRMYASNGNAADVSIPEILQYWAGDDKTRVIILHIESLANPHEFIEVAKRITPLKPILGIKTGRTELGARAVASHTGSLMKADTAVESVFKKCGIISFNNQEDICQCAIAFAQQPIPQGRSVGIITNTGGPGIITTDECIEGGLNIAELSEETRTHLKSHLFPEATVSNPVDVLATAGPKEYAIAIESLLSDPKVDSVIINFITPFFVDCEGVAREIKRISAEAKKPLLAVVMTDKKQWAGTLEIIKSSGVPVYDLPETASKALVALTRYGEYRSSELGVRSEVMFNDVNIAETRKIISDTKKSGREFLSLGEALAVLYNYRIPSAKFVLVERLEDIPSAVNYVGFPLVLKVDAPEIIHKTEEKAVFLNITTKEALKDVIDNISKKPSRCDIGTRYLIQEYLTGGREVIIGGNYIESLGHLIMFGLGGIFVEVIKDVAFAINPLSRLEVEEMIHSIKGFKILAGVRGQKPVDMDKLVEIMLRVSQLLNDCPEIKEIDLNPIMLYPEKERCSVVDVRIRV